MLNMIKKSLKKQIIFLLFIPMFLMTLFIISRYYYAVNSELHKSIELQAVQLVDRTSVALEDDIRFSKYFELSSTVLNLFNLSIKYNGQEVFKIREVVLLDLHNRVLAHSDPLNNPLLSQYTSLKKPSEYSNSISGIQFSWNDEDTILNLKNEIILHGEPIGVLYVIIEPKSLIQIQNQIRIEVIVLLCVIVFGLFLFLLIFSKWVEKPVTIIKNELNNLGNAEVSFDTLNEREDEFKQITQSIINADKRIHKQKNQLLEEKEFTERILNAQTNFTLVTDGKALKNANKAMLEFFGYETLEDFHQEHDCICDFFIDEDGYLSKEINGQTWIEEIRQNLDVVYYVKIKNLQRESRIFQIVTVDEKIKDKNESIIVLTFTDITELKELQTKLEEKVAFQLDQLRRNDSIILEQTKMVALGEMIGNIAHQWRQPLSVISTGATGILMQKEYNTLNDEEFKKVCNLINDNAQFLSRTIDDFKNFIKNDRELETFNLKAVFESFLNLVNPSINKHRVIVIENFDETIELDGYPNELIQCFMNIFNNSKDALKISASEKKYIFIDTFKENGNTIIKFRDNAGGIPEDIITRIFEPYFTTKHKSQGTGLGLSMTYKLIVEGMKGSITVKNIDIEYDDKSYKGAEFVITLPTRLS